jgi:hypothetical protein
MAERYVRIYNRRLEIPLGEFKSARQVLAFLNKSHKLTVPADGESKPGKEAESLDPVVAGLMKTDFSKEQAEDLASKATVSAPGEAFAKTTVFRKDEAVIGPANQPAPVELTIEPAPRPANFEAVQGEIEEELASLIRPALSWPEEARRERAQGEPGRHARGGLSETGFPCRMATRQSIRTLRIP